jgi:hypothetical protein
MNGKTGDHAAAVGALIPASHRRDAWLGDATGGGSSFPQTDGEHLFRIKRRVSISAEANLHKMP